MQAIPPLIPQSLNAADAHVDVLEVDNLVVVNGGVVNVTTLTANTVDATTVDAITANVGTVNADQVNVLNRLFCGNNQASVATLVAGTVTVTVSPEVGLSATDLVLVTRNTPAGTVGDLSVPVASYNTVARTFVINSDNALDTSTVNWFLVKPL